MNFYRPVGLTCNSMYRSKEHISPLTDTRNYDDVRLVICAKDVYEIYLYYKWNFKLHRHVC